MSQQQGEYSLQQDIEEAFGMQGKGYDNPSLEIEAPRTVTERRDGKLVEVDRPAFVKIYTNFKSELKDIDPDALKVWLFIALSVNRFSGEAHPGLRAISEGVGMAVNTVRTAVERLETNYNLLQVEKEEGKTNKYYPTDYVSANRDGVSRDDTVPGTGSIQAETVSKNGGTVSTQYRKSAQPENQKLKPEKEEEAVNPLFALFMNNVSMVTPIIADAIEKAEKDFSTAWVEDVIRLAGKNGAKSWNYCAAILERWKREGKAERPVKKQPTGADPSRYKNDAYAEYYA